MAPPLQSELCTWEAAQLLHVVTEQLFILPIVDLIYLIYMCVYNFLQGRHQEVPGEARAAKA